MPFLGFLGGAVTADFGTDCGGSAQTTSNSEVNTRREEGVDKR